MSDVFSDKPLRKDDFQPGGRPVLWKEGWKLFRVSEGRRELGIDYGEVYLTQEKLSNPSEGNFFIIYTEAGSGLSSLNSWLTVTAENISNLDFTRTGLHGQTTQEKINPFIQKLGWDETADSGHGHLIVTLSALDAIDDELASVFIGELRSKAEEAAKRLPFLIFVGRLKPVRDDGMFSELVAQTALYRIAHWTENDVSNLVNDQEEAPRLKEMAASSIEWTGGSPLLVQSYLQEAVGQPHLSAESLGQSLRDRPPRVVNKWQRQLAELIDDQLLRHYLQSLVAGQEFPGNENITVFREFFLSGWIRRASEENRVWVIRSKCHQAWARAVLRNPSSFRRKV